MYTCAGYSSKERFPAEVMVAEIYFSPLTMPCTKIKAASPGRRAAFF